MHVTFVLDVASLNPNDIGEQLVGLPNPSLPIQNKNCLLPWLSPVVVRICMYGRTLFQEREREMTHGAA